MTYHCQASRPCIADTNAILECHRVAAWRAISAGYRLETVEGCIAETQTGNQWRLPEQQIDPTKLRDSSAAIYSVEDFERTKLLILASGITLDKGEHCLWAHVHGRKDHCKFCGPDTASLRLGVRLGYIDRLVSLEQLLNDSGYRYRTPLRRNYTKKWLAEKPVQLILSEGKLIN